MRVRTGVVGAVSTVLAVSTLGAIPVVASEEGVGDVDVVEPAAADFSATEVSDGVVVQTVDLHPEVADVDVPEVSPPKWATAQARELAHAEPGVLTEALAVEPFQLAAVTWTGDRPVTAWVRTRPAGGEWTPWYQLPEAAEHGPNPDSPEAEGTRQGTDPLLVARSYAVQVRVSAADGSAELPTDLRLDLAGSEQLPGDDDVPPGGSADGADRGDTGEAPGEFEAYGAPRHTIYSRATWGADESMRADPPEYGVVEGGIVHHTVSATNYTAAQVPSMIRSIYAYHVNGRGWNDIGYNFLVDKFDRAWEGRWGGVTKPVIGAHTLGYNDDAFGVAAIGTYTSAKPTSGMIAAFERLMAWKFTIHGVDPRYPVYYDGDRSNSVSGHRNHGSTECPGDALYARLPALRNAIIVRMALEPSRDLNQDIAPDLIATKSDGTLWYSRGNGSGSYKSPVRLGSGWHRMRLPAIGGDMMRNRYDELLAVRSSDGQLWQFPGKANGSFGSHRLIGTGWNAINLLAAPGDMDGDGYRDVVGRRASDGSLWLYRGTSNGGLGSRKYLAGHWGQNNLLISAGDWNGDGHVDLITRNRQSGNLFLVPGRGNGTLGGVVRIGTGWHGLTVVGAGDMNADGRPDLAVRKSDGSLWRYPGNGAGGFGTPVRLGGGWNQFNRLF